MYFRNMTFIFLDTETSGLDPYIADITECGCILIDEIDGKYKANLKTTFHKRFLLQNSENAQEEALEIGHYSEELWKKTAVPADQGLRDLNQWLQKVGSGSKPIIVAQNAEFDKSMIFSNCDRFLIFPYIDNAWVDLIALWVVYKEFNNLHHLNNNQGVISKHFDVINVKAHAALSDAATGAVCFCHILNYLKNVK